MTQCCDLFIFGGTGDLAFRKLIPALYYLEAGEQLNEVRNIYGLGRGHLETADYVAQLTAAVPGFINQADWDPQIWDRFRQRLHYRWVDATEPTHFDTMAKHIRDGESGQRIFYLATHSALYGPICDNLLRSGISRPGDKVVLEKPIGNDLNTCCEINEQVAQVFPEKNIYRIDHYLGKETVQNLIALRFGNPIFSHVWDNKYIDNVQITVAEQVGVGQRGEFYADVGALRDMMQNHILQLLCLVAMEAPVTMHPDAVRDEKVKVLNSLQPIDSQQVRKVTARGFYTKGSVNGEAVPGLIDELPPELQNRGETFVALRATVNNWRWAQVPFYLRTGKRMSERYSEIVISFRPNRFSLFPNNEAAELSNKLVIRLQPEQNISLVTMNKKPDLGGEMILQPRSLDLTPNISSLSRNYDAYERLLLDVIQGDQTLFMRRDEVEEAWRWIDTIIDSWQAAGMSAKGYAAGTMGPSAAVAITEREGHSWHE